MDVQLMFQKFHKSKTSSPNFCNNVNFSYLFQAKNGVPKICYKANFVQLKIISRCGVQDKSFLDPNEDQIRSLTCQEKWGAKIDREFQISFHLGASQELSKKFGNKLQKDNNNKIKELQEGDSPSILPTRMSHTISPFLSLPNFPLLLPLLLLQ